MGGVPPPVLPKSSSSHTCHLYSGSPFYMLRVRAGLYRVSGRSSQACATRALTRVFSTSHAAAKVRHREAPYLCAALQMQTSASSTSIVPDWYHDDNLYTDESLSRTLGPKGKRECFTNKRDLKLASYFFPAATTQPQALAVLIHGHGCSLVHEFLHHIEAGKPHVYESSLVDQLNKRGIAVAGIDLQGCGFSEGMRCYIDRYEDYVEDIQDFIKSLQDSKVEGFANLPVFVIGESLGGCISVDVCKAMEEVKGAVLVAPMLSLERVSKAGLNPYLRPLASLASRFIPTWQIAKTERNNLYPEIQAYFDEDPQTWKGWTRARNASEYLRVTELLCASGMSSVKFPFQVHHGDADTMTDPSGSARLMELAQSTDKQLETYPNRWHVLLKESNSEVVIKKIVDWIGARA